MPRIQIHYQDPGPATSNKDTQPQSNELETPRSHPWLVNGEEWVSHRMLNTGTDPRPAISSWESTHHYQAVYIARRRPDNDGSRLQFDLSLPGPPGGPYTLHGSVMYKTYRASDAQVVQGEFRIEGTRTLVAKPGGVVAYRHRFQIVEGSGTGDFVGISGEGTLQVDIDEEWNEPAAEIYWARVAEVPFGYGTLVLDNLNDAGALLL
ncbi:MAG: hypothetical protein Q9226_005515 [Calogaya cf. arnoldii]